MSFARRSLSALCLLGAASLASHAAAVFDNPGFESGDFTGWEVDEGIQGNAFVGDSFVGAAPAEGSRCAVLWTGLRDQDTRVWQTVDASAGDVISGWAAFTTFDFYPWDDRGQVAILAGDGSGSDAAVVFDESVASVGDQGSSGWVPWEFEVPADGAYTVMARIHNVLDSGGLSFLGLDGIAVTAAEPDVIAVAIDVRPGDDGNCIHLGSRGVVPVVLYGSAGFDVEAVDPSTLRLGDAAEAHGEGHLEDADGDGYLDLVGHFRMAETGLDGDATEVSLTGATTDGASFEGTDAVRVR